MRARCACARGVRAREVRVGGGARERETESESKVDFIEVGKSEHFYEGNFIEGGKSEQFYEGNWSEKKGYSKVRGPRHSAPATKNLVKLHKLLRSLGQTVTLLRTSY